MQVSEAACRDVQVEVSNGENRNDAFLTEFSTVRGEESVTKGVRGSRNFGALLLCALTAMQVQTPWENN